jgi:hypothetical protein
MGFGDWDLSWGKLSLFLKQPKVVQQNLLGGNFTVFPGNIECHFTFTLGSVTSVLI